METYLEIEINGADIEVVCEVGYAIDGGQKEILYPNDKSQPGHSAEVEEIYLESAYIGYGKFEYHLGEDSRWWNYIEEKLNEDDLVKDNIMSYESERQEMGQY